MIYTTFEVGIRGWLGFPARREVRTMRPSSRVRTSDLLPGFLARSISTMAGTACLSTWRERKTRVFTATVWVEATTGMAREIGQERTEIRCPLSWGGWPRGNPGVTIGVLAYSPPVVRYDLEGTVPRQDALAL
jgi:hypothetical protein